ncbi:MAG: hypothetical protein IPK82_41360 [Polyangiaceae bacterium]|nr:hypothetical protein [Polyangiaceae bacterium]
MKHRSLSLFAASFAFVPVMLCACAGPPLTSPIEGEPVCPDFEVGAAKTKMSGGLRFPVQVTLKRGSTVVFKTTVVGLRSDKDTATRILLSDDNETYTVEWGQCENERAPAAVEGKGRDTKGAAKYECGTATAYKTDQLVTKKGDAKSHVLAFAAPPNPACLAGTAPPPPADAGAPDASGDDASAPDAATEMPDAGADAEPPNDAGATGNDAGADAGDAGSDAGVKGAEKTK